MSSHWAAQIGFELVTLLPLPFKELRLPAYTIISDMSDCFPIPPKVCVCLCRGGISSGSSFSHLHLHLAHSSCKPLHGPIPPSAHPTTAYLPPLSHRYFSGSTHSVYTTSIPPFISLCSFSSLAHSLDLINPFAKYTGSRKNRLLQGCWNEQELISPLDPDTTTHC